MSEKQNSIKEEVRRLKIFSKRLMHSSLSGDYTAAFKGSGFDFHQLREYHTGDDVRLMHWNSYAKTGQLMVKEMIPERGRTVVIALDCSKSLQFTSQMEAKKAVAAKVASALIFMAENSNDKVGILLFSDRVNLWCEPKKGHSQSFRLINQIHDFSSDARETKIGPAFDFLAQLKAQNALLFFISDLIAADFAEQEKTFYLLNKKFDTVAIQVSDKNETTFPNVGLLDLQDLETGGKVAIDTADPELAFYLKARQAEQKNKLLSKGIELLNIDTSDDVIRKLIKFFHHKAKKR